MHNPAAAHNGCENANIITCVPAKDYENGSLAQLPCQVIDIETALGYAT